MQQPALGQRLLALRQEKGLTQEELVAECNISVRTIQRIEAGEVTPRAYTIKTILSALGEDFEEFTESRVESSLKKAFFLKIDDTKYASFLQTQLTIAFIAGIIYFFLGFAEGPADGYRMMSDQIIFPTFTYIALKAVVLVSLSFFLRGFILAGNILKNYLLKVSVFILLALNVVFYLYDIGSLFMENDYYPGILIAESVALGITGILMGIAVIRLTPAVGNIAMVAGIFEIITYSCLASVIFSLGGLIIWFPTIVLEIVLLYRIRELVNEKQKELSKL